MLLFVQLHKQGGLLNAQFDIFELVAEFRRFRMSIVQVRKLYFTHFGSGSLLFFRKLLTKRAASLTYMHMFLTLLASTQRP